ncbi:MAG TPA: glycosyltransferase family 2 protein [Silvibacterium sp.]|nr:glycosyltransferase family 2 protein [Silvibacterium sp.]
MTNSEPTGTLSYPAVDEGHHIAVCICTMKRPDLLTRTLSRLERQKSEGRFTYSIIVADNDSLRSAEPAVEEFGRTTQLKVVYCNEPRANIALARNKALEAADGDLVAFIDDDEFPADEWLLEHFKVLSASNADGVLGPVEPHFETEPQPWVKKGRFFQRPRYATGHQLGWEQSRTGNVLFKKSILERLQVPFRPQFETAGEDMDFFRRAMDVGCRFIWSDEAVVYEVVPSSRCNRSYLLRRALLRGSNFPKHPEHRLQNLAKSLIALPCYTISLPILALFGQHVSLKYLIKILDHASRLVAFLGLALVTERQT